MPTGGMPIPGNTPAPQSTSLSMGVLCSLITSRSRQSGIQGILHPVEHLAALVFGGCVGGATPLEVLA
jgi:hypothetical protein